MSELRFNPYRMKLRHMKVMEDAWKVRFTALVKRMEGKSFDIAELSANELMALVYMVKVVHGEDPNPDDIADMDWDDLSNVVESMATEDATVDPTSGD